MSFQFLVLSSEFPCNLPSNSRGNWKFRIPNSEFRIRKNLSLDVR